MIVFWCAFFSFIFSDHMADHEWSLKMGRHYYEILANILRSDLIVTLTLNWIALRNYFDISEHFVIIYIYYIILYRNRGYARYIISFTRLSLAKGCQKWIMMYINFSMLVTPLVSQLPAFLGKITSAEPGLSFEWYPLQLWTFNEHINTADFISQVPGV